MKKIIFLLSLFVFCQMFGQKKYSFDYALVYEEHCKEHIKPYEMIYVINSKKNNYRIYVHDKDSTKYAIHFLDEDGVAVNGIIRKSDFYKAETITNNCNQTFRYSNLAKEKKDNYKVVNCNDTIVNDTSYYHYKIICTKSLNYQKRNKIVTAHFIIDKNKPEFNILPTESIIYQKWLESKSFPNGLVIIFYFVNTKGITTSKLDLKGIVKVDKFLTIPEECDYTKEEIRNKVLN